jgi:hypothetical protein
VNRWTARVAPLGVAAPDRRWLDPAGSWVIADGGPVALATIGADRRRVGLVASVTVRDGAIWASGTVDDPGIAEQMRNRELRPAMELAEESRAKMDVDFDAAGEPEVIRFRSGRVSAIAVAPHPTWDDVWFEVERPGPA